MNVVTKDANITSLFGKAVHAHNAGDFSRAEQLYQETLSLQPDHSEASHNIGAIVPKANHALTFKLGHSSGAAQVT